MSQGSIGVHVDSAWPAELATVEEPTRDRDHSRGNCQSSSGHEGSNRCILTIRPSGSR